MTKILGPGCSIVAFLMRLWAVHHRVGESQGSLLVLSDLGACLRAERVQQGCGLVAARSFIHLLIHSTSVLELSALSCPPAPQA